MPELLETRLDCSLAPEDAADLDRREHLDNIARTERTLGLGALLVVLFAALDVVQVHVSKYPAIDGVWVPRAALATLALVVRARIGRRPDVTPGWLEGAHVAVFGWAAVTITLLCVQSGGFASPDVRGLALVLIAQVVSLPARCTRAALRLGVTVAIYLGTMGLAAVMFPFMAAQLADSQVAAGFADGMGVVLAAGALLVGAGHAHWQARRRVMATRTVGRYVLDKRIGHGGMGDVWRAHHPALRRDVAIKIMRPDCVTPAMNARFEREISMMTELSHPNTVRIFDCGRTPEGLLYCVMELCAGRTLRELVAAEGPLRPARAVHIVRQVARALAEAHGRRIVHRDIKPDNIVVTSAGGERDFVKVLDFGIAKLEMEEASASDLTEEHFVIGTPAYMSPEQAQARGVDPRSDIYALGAVLFFAITGRPPFQGSIVELLWAHREKAPPPVAGLVDDFVHPALDVIIRRCLAKDPRRRFSSALELDAALGAIPFDEASEAPPASRARRSSRPAAPVRDRAPHDDTTSRVRPLSAPVRAAQVGAPGATVAPLSTVRVGPSRRAGA